MTKTKLRAPVPKRDEKPTMGLTSNKNYITANAVEVILAKPGKVPQEDFQWTTRPGYGQVPMYLRRNKAIVQQERENFEQYVRMHQAPVSVVCVNWGCWCRGCTSVLTRAKCRTRAALSGAHHWWNLPPRPCFVGPWPGDHAAVDGGPPPAAGPPQEEVGVH